MSSLYFETREVVLSGSGYDVTGFDNQVVFRSNDGMNVSNFTLEWVGCIWVFVDFESWAGRIFASHIKAALDWVEKELEYSWKEGNAILQEKGGQ